MNDSKIRVALFGGRGFAGHNVLNLLEEAGHTVGVFSRTTGLFWRRQRREVKDDGTYTD